MLELNNKQLVVVQQIADGRAERVIDSTIL